MDNIKVIKSQNHSIKVVTKNDQLDFLSSSDMDMDIRAKTAVKVAVEKAKFCKKSIAKYDLKTKKAYVESSVGGKRYVE